MQILQKKIYSTICTYYLLILRLKTLFIIINIKCNKFIIIKCRLIMIVVYYYYIHYYQKKKKEKKIKYKYAYMHQ